MAGDEPRTADDESGRTANRRGRPVVRRLMSVLSAAGLVATGCLCVWGYRRGVFTSPDALADILAQAGFWAPLLFVLFQIVQVVIPIIPGALSMVAGVLVFGPVLGFAYNFVGIVIGSVLNFALARRYGRPFVQAMMSPRAYQKYFSWLDRDSAFDKWFAIAIFSPVAPDDYLCFIAGLTKMPLRRFLAIILLGKPVSIAAYSLGLAFATRWLVGLIT
ncbi:MAG: TVP38/TMEM64 family protein [Propionibacteriaceae bacterium]|nr:TVP38/TMEM64 family protein [Propionibacteriaceae bacterium]